MISNQPNVHFGCVRMYNAKGEPFVYCHKSVADMSNDYIPQACIGPYTTLRLYEGADFTGDKTQYKSDENGSCVNIYKHVGSMHVGPQPYHWMLSKLTNNPIYHTAKEDARKVETFVTHLGAKLLATMPKAQRL